MSAVDEDDDEEDVGNDVDCVIIIVGRYMYQLSLMVSHSEELYCASATAGRTSCE